MQVVQLTSDVYIHLVSVPLLPREPSALIKAKLVMHNRPVGLHSLQKGDGLLPAHIHPAVAPLQAEVCGLLHTHISFS